MLELVCHGCVFSVHAHTQAFCEARLFSQTNSTHGKKKKMGCWIVFFLTNGCRYWKHVNLLDIFFKNSEKNGWFYSVQLLAKIKWVNPRHHLFTVHIYIYIHNISSTYALFKKWGATEYWHCFLFMYKKKNSECTYWTLSLLKKTTANGAFYHFVSANLWCSAKKFFRKLCNCGSRRVRTVNFSRAPREPHVAIHLAPPKVSWH